MCKSLMLYLFIFMLFLKNPQPLFSLFFFLEKSFESFISRFKTKLTVFVFCDSIWLKSKFICFLFFIFSILLSFISLSLVLYIKQSLMNIPFSLNLAMYLWFESTSFDILRLLVNLKLPKLFLMLYLFLV